MKFCIHALAAGIALLPLGAAAQSYPETATLHFRSNLGIPVSMTFQRQGMRYQIVSDTQIPLIIGIRLEAQGRIVGDKLQPESYRDIRNGKTYAAAEFGQNTITYRDKNGHIRNETHAVPTFDILSLAWQMSATRAQIPSQSFVSNGKKTYPLAQLHRQADSVYRYRKQTLQLQHYRLQTGKYTLSYAFAPQLKHLPVQISYESEGKSYQLELIQAQVNGEMM